MERRHEQTNNEAHATAFESFAAFEKQRLTTIESIEGQAPIRLLELFPEGTTEVTFNNGNATLNVEKVDDHLVKVDNTYTRYLSKSPDAHLDETSGERTVPKGTYYGARVYFVERSIPDEKGNSGEILIHESWVEPTAPEFSETTKEGFKDVLIDFLTRDERHHPDQRNVNNPHSPLVNIAHMYDGKNTALSYGSHWDSKVFFKKDAAIDFAKLESKQSALLDEKSIDAGSFGLVSKRRLLIADKILNLIGIEQKDESDVPPTPEDTLNDVERQIALQQRHLEAKTDSDADFSAQFRKLVEVYTDAARD